MNNIKIAFFTEAGKKRGLGHAVRSYTLHSMALSLGIKSYFYLDSDIDLSEKFPDFKEFSWDEFHVPSPYDIIFVDSYEASVQQYQEIANICQTTVYIDDFKRLKYPKGIILNFSPDANQLLYSQKEKQYTYLLGLEYIPIRKEFLKEEPTPKEQIFIMLGGSDTAKATLDIYNKLKNISIKKCIVTNSKEDAEILSKDKILTLLYKPTDKQLVRAMKNSSIAISTASMTLYELASFRINTIIVAANKEQVFGAKTLIKHRVADYYIPLDSPTFQEDLLYCITHLQQKHKKESPLIDGLGAKRILDAVIGTIS